MEKIKLNNENILENVIEACDCYIKVQVENATEAVKIFDNMLTSEALERIETLSENDDIMNVFINKCKKSLEYENGVATFVLDDIDKTEQRLSALEDTIDALVLSDMGIGESEE
jgi:hypothetical protein